MFKGSSERQSFTSRVASHSTKGRANGRVDILPAGTEAEEVYVNLKQQHLILDSQLKDLHEQKLQITADERWKYKPHKVSRLAQIEQQVDQIADQRREFAVVLRAKGSDAFGWCFMAVAELRLPTETMRAIQAETREIMGRFETEITSTGKLKHRGKGGQE